MSDGPYRSLPMSRTWKRVAEFSENENFAHADVCAASNQALTNTWQDEVTDAVVRGIRSVFLDRQGGLFVDDVLARLHEVSGDTAGYGLARLLVDHAAAVAGEGKTGETGLQEAARRTLEAYAARTMRQIEEHYCRKASARLTRQVRDRIARAMNSADFRALARTVTGLDAAPRRAMSPKHTALDEGVPL